jgi:hypothetical protein
MGNWTYKPESQNWQVKGVWVTKNETQLDKLKEEIQITKETSSNMKQEEQSGNKDEQTLFIKQGKPLAKKQNAPPKKQPYIYDDKRAKYKNDMNEIKQILYQNGQVHLSRKERKHMEKLELQKKQTEKQKKEIQQENKKED